MRQPTPAPVQAAPHATVTPADLTKIYIDPSTAPGWQEFEKRADLLQFSIATQQASGQFMILPWDPTWPDDGAGFESKRVKGEGYRFSVQQRTIAPDEWLFRGTYVFDAGTTHPAFEMMRSINGARFVCSGMAQADDVADVDTGIAGCRAARL